MFDLMPQHGGTDAGPEPRYDFSTNANPLGPCPAVLDAVRGADLTRYPDPRYTDLRAALATYHRTTPDCIVVGAGASELVLRLIRHTHDTVAVLGPTFSEYARCARLEARAVIETASPEAFRAARQRGLGFVCWPNNPTGEAWPLSFLSCAAEAAPLVVDFAYAPLCADGQMQAAEAAAGNAIRLYAPNKAFGLTGLRAGYVVTPAPMPRLAALAPSWVIDQAAQAFLRASIRPEALDWLSRCRPTIAAWRMDLARSLQAMGLGVQASPATFLLARVGPATAVTEALRQRGLRVRDATSFGLPDWIRLAAAPPDVQADLLGALRSVLRDPGLR